MRLGQALRYWGAGVGTRAAQNGKIKVTIIHLKNLLHFHRKLLQKNEIK